MVVLNADLQTGPVAGPVLLNAGRTPKADRAARVGVGAVELPPLTTASQPRRYCMLPPLELAVGPCSSAKMSCFLSQTSSFACCFLFWNFALSPVSIASI